MKNHTTTIIVAVIAILITFFITSALLPRQAVAPTSQTPQGSVIIPMNIVTIYQNASTSPTVSIEYPQFPSLSSQLNDEIASATMSRLQQFRQDIAENDSARRATTAPGQQSAIIPQSAYSFMATWQPAQINSRYVSFIERFDTYNGGANENQELTTFNYDLVKHKTMTLDDLFASDGDYLSTISGLARTQLEQTLSTASYGSVSADMLNAGTEPTTDNFSNFTFTDYNVTFYFPKYAVAPGSFGEQRVVLPRNLTK